MYRATKYVHQRLVSHRYVLLIDLIYNVTVILLHRFIFLLFFIWCLLIASNFNATWYLLQYLLVFNWCIVTSSMDAEAKIQIYFKPCCSLVFRYLLIAHIYKAAAITSSSKQLLCLLLLKNCGLTHTFALNPVLS